MRIKKGNQQIIKSNSHLPKAAAPSFKLPIGGGGGPGGPGGGGGMAIFELFLLCVIWRKEIRKQIVCWVNHYSLCCVPLRFIRNDKLQMEKFLLVF